MHYFDGLIVNSVSRNHQLNFTKGLRTSVGEKINASTPCALYRARPFLVTTPLSDDDFHILCYTLGDNLDKELKFLIVLSYHFS